MEFRYNGKYIVFESTRERNDMWDDAMATRCTCGYMLGEHEIKGMGLTLEVTHCLQTSRCSQFRLRSVPRSRDYSYAR